MPVDEPDVLNEIRQRSMHTLELDNGARTAALVAPSDVLTIPMLERGMMDVVPEIARVFEVPLRDLERWDLLGELVQSDSDVVALANIVVALRQKLADGRLQDIARLIDVDVSTVSRWVTGVTSPSRAGSKPWRGRCSSRLTPRPRRTFSSTSP